GVFRTTFVLRHGGAREHKGASDAGEQDRLTGPEFMQAFHVLLPIDTPWATEDCRLENSDHLAERARAPAPAKMPVNRDHAGVKATAVPTLDGLVFGMRVRRAGPYGASLIKSRVGPLRTKKSRKRAVYATILE